MAYGTTTFGRVPFGYAVPASETKEGKERLVAYYAALGCFIDMFSRVETAVTLMLWRYAKTDPATAKVIFSGVTLASSLSFIRQLIKIDGVDASICDDADYILNHLGKINQTRNLIIHYGASSAAEGRAIVSNALKARGVPTEFPISPDVLEQMTSDLKKIIFHINYKHLGRPSPRGALGQKTLSDMLSAKWNFVS